MLGNFFRQNSKDLERIQILCDPIFITLIYNFLYEGKFSDLNNIISVDIFIFLTTYTILNLANLYKSYRNKGFLKICITVIKVWLYLSITFLVINLFFLEDFLFQEFSKWLIGILLVLILDHLIIRIFLRLFRKEGLNSRNILFWGTYDSFLKLFNELNQNSWIGMKISNWFSSEELNDINLSKYKCNGNIDDLRKWLKNNEADYIIFSEDNPKIIKELLDIFGDTSSHVSFLPPWENLYISYEKYNLGSKNLIEIWGNNKSYLDLKLKRLVDITFSFAALFIFSPVFILTFFALLFDKSGPVFFTQDRYGYHGKNFKMYKFRSLKTMDPGNLKGLKHVTLNDKRMTLIGRFIRSWSIDELPQFINVIKGDMSLVGPRPHAIEHNEYYRKLVPGYMQRHASKPGITGLAQVNGYRGDIKNIKDMEKRIEYDLKYLKEWTLKLDIKILFRTIFALRGV